MVDVRILGISATVIKDGNCDTMVKEALKATKELDDPKMGKVETEFITTADKEIALCIHCQWCIENRSPCKIEDDFHAVADAMHRADGLILGAPVWVNTLSPPLQILFSRVRYENFFTQDFRNMPVAALTTGFLGFGLERTIDSIKHMIYMSNMIPVAEARPLASTRAFGERPKYTEHGVLDDTWGMQMVEIAAWRVVEVARMVKYATDAGVVLPYDYIRTCSGGKVRKKEDVTLVKGVWREKEGAG